MERSALDVIVIGAGPAGSAAARLLATWGHRVALVGRGPRHAPLGESLPPSCTKLFDQLGVRSPIDSAGFVRATGNTVRWAGNETRVERFEAGIAGYQVVRDRFDALLARTAGDAGAATQLDAAVRDVRRDGDEWIVAYDTRAGGAELRARWVVDASGRAGVVARRGWRQPAAAARTTAVVAVWEPTERWPVDDETHTLVESYGGGWAWSIPGTANQRFVTVMLDPSVTDLPGRARLGAAYAAEIARTTMISELVASARIVGDVWACDASPYHASQVFGDGAVLVGDAASFVDPLSSFGVKKALASAWLGAVAVNTALADSRMATPALELFGERERVMYDHLQRQSALLSQEAAGAHAGAFWDGRSDASLDALADDLDVGGLRSDTRVLAAFDEIRRRPSINLRRADSVQTLDRATVRGNRIVLEHHLASPALPRAVRYCRNVDLVLVTELADRYDQVPDLYDAYNRAAPPAPLPDFLGALSTLVGLGLLSFA